MRYIGHLDYLDLNRFRGWAAAVRKDKKGREIAEPVEVFIEHDGTGVRTEVQPNCERDDLLGKGLPYGAGFDYAHGLVLAEGDLVRVITPDGNDLAGSPLVVKNRAGSNIVKGDYPELLMVSPLTQCNLNCLHCISKTTRSSVSELKLQQWAEIEQAISDGKIHHISSDYSGDIINTSIRKKDWLSKFIDTGSQLRIDTHANDIDDRISEKLLNSNLSSITFSLDSMDDKSYAKIRKGSKPLPEVLSNIERFMLLKRRSGSQFQTIISFSLMNSSVLSLISSLYFAKKNHIDLVQFHHVMVFKENVIQESLIPRPYFYKVIYDIILNKAKELRVNIHLPSPVLSSKVEHGHEHCSAPWEVAFVLGNGDVMACCMPGTVMGNLNFASLREIWNGEQFARFRSGVNSDTNQAPCNNCPIYRKKQNFKSYVPGSNLEMKQEFEQDCIRNIENYEKDRKLMKFIKYNALYYLIFIKLIPYIWKSRKDSRIKMLNRLVFAPVLRCKNRFELFFS